VVDLSKQDSNNYFVNSAVSLTSLILNEVPEGG